MVIQNLSYTFIFCDYIGSESPAGFDVGSLKTVTGCADGMGVGKGNQGIDEERYREMAKLLVAGNTLEDQPNRRHTSSSISAPYEVPQYPIEQIESKLNR